MVPTRLASVTRFKWIAFRVLEWLSELRHGRSDADDGKRPLTTASSASQPLWVYASTIGELNAIRPFLRQLLEQMQNPPLVLLTDHPHYRDSFLAACPGAVVWPLDHRSRTVAALVARGTPRLLLVAEIPCGLSDAPCRFPFAVMYEAKRRAVPACLVNGWPYGQSPSSTMDVIEKGLFGRDYLGLFDLVTVQDEAAREAVVAQGADPRRVFVTGNIKYDALDAPAWTAAGAKSPTLVEGIASGPRPTIVAGCVTNISEQEVALDAFAVVRKQIPDALLVLAPRHPEVQERMTKLTELLAERRLTHAFKSSIGDLALPADLHCLVLDTMGELKDFYAAGDVTYVGLNHNVLEPLAFGKPVVVTPGWNPVYPSYPVYRQMLAQGTITQVEADAIGAVWLDLLADAGTRSSKSREIAAMLGALKGATARNMELLEKSGLLRPRDAASTDAYA